MRRTLEIIALFLLLFLWTVTITAVSGPRPLPRRIPTHFNLTGQPDGWGTPAMLYMLPAIGTVIYLLMTIVARFPAAFNFPVHAAPRTRTQLEGIALNMIAWLKTEVLCLLAWIQYGTIRIVREGQGRLSPLCVPLLLMAVFATIAGSIVLMRRVARSGS